VLLKDICTVGVACCGRETGIYEAARLMRQHHCGDLVVVDDPAGDRVPAGILTDRDIVIEVLAAERDIAKTTVAQVMSSKLVIADGSESVADGVERMRLHGVRRLPVVDHKGGLLGIVTLDDLLRTHASQAAALAAIVTKEQDYEQRSRR
jgi:CBS domain-containing protein